MFLSGSALRFCQRQPPEVRANLEALQHALLPGICFTAPTFF